MTNCSSSKWNCKPLSVLSKKSENQIHFFRPEVEEKRGLGAYWMLIVQLLLVAEPPRPLN